MSEPSVHTVDWTETATVATVTAGLLIFGLVALKVVSSAGGSFTVATTGLTVLVNAAQ